MKKLLIGLMLLTSMPSFANSLSKISEIEATLYQRVCGNNLPSFSEANELSEIPNDYRMTRFEHARHYSGEATNALLRLMSHAGIVEKDMVVVDLAYELSQNIHSHRRTMLSMYTSFEYKYNGLVNLCSYLNTRISN